MKWNRCLVGTVAVTMITAGAFAQTIPDRAVDSGLAEQQQELASVAAARTHVIRDIVDQWRVQLSPGNPALNLASGEEQLTEALLSASAEKLLAASRAQSYEELGALLARRGQEQAMIALEPGQAIPNVLGSTTGDLVFTPITPCRIIDTRLATGALAGRLVAGLGKQFKVNLADYTAQGGSATGCAGLPGSPFRPGAVAINVTSTDQTGPGNLRVVQSGGGVPTVSLLNYTPGVNLANAAVASAATTSGLGDIFILSSNSDSHVIVDIMGFFGPPVATALDCVAVYNTVATAVPAGSDVCADPPACPSGYIPTAPLFDNDSFGGLVASQLNDPGVGGTAICGFNASAASKNYFAGQRCCRVPGR